MKTKRFQLSLFIFRRDLRLHDNTALINALNESEQVIPCFIFDDQQIKNNDYFCAKAFRFMLEGLQGLTEQLKNKNGHLAIFHGKPEEVVSKLITTLPIDSVYMNRDYTPFSIQRDQAIQKVVEKNKKHLFIFADALLNEPEEIKKPDGSPYTIFTPFMRKSRILAVSKPRSCLAKNYYVKSIELDNPALLDHYLKKYPDKNEHHGSRSAGKMLLKNINALKNYSTQRDFPYKNATSHLSAHHKFGTISIRETYEAYINEFNNPIFISELYWRDFFTHIVFHFPHVLGESFHSKFNNITWSNREDYFEAWCHGKTGFPIVDAGMRELNETGLMHNRVRMITASFLVKDLHIDWRRGEKYFAKHLIDYDPAVNNGNWQWAASTGCDAQPYFRIFNPWLQQKRFDAEGLYIKKWVPQLHSIPAKHGTGVGQLYDAIDETQTALSQPFATHELTEILMSATTEHQPPLVQGRRVKLRYAHVGSKRPLVFVVHGKQVDKLPGSYKQYLINYFRDKLKLVGIPLIIKFICDNNPFAPTEK